MHPVSVLLAVPALFFAIAHAPVQAACLAEGLSCTMPKHRIMEVCAGTEQFTYSFGSGERNELELGMPFETANVTPWIGAGQSMWSWARFDNGAHSYEVWADAPRGGDGTLTAGVKVYAGEQMIANLECLPGTVEGSAEFFGEVMENRGYCYEPQAEIWSRCP